MMTLFLFFMSGIHLRVSAEISGSALLTDGVYPSRSAKAAARSGFSV